MALHPELDKLVVLDDEARHLHDASFALFRCIQPTTLSGRARTFRENPA